MGGLEGPALVDGANEPLHDRPHSRALVVASSQARSTERSGGLGHVIIANGHDSTIFEGRRFRKKVEEGGIRECGAARAIRRDSWGGDQMETRSSVDADLQLYVGLLCN